MTIILKLIIIAIIFNFLIEKTVKRISIAIYILIAFNFSCHPPVHSYSSNDNAGNQKYSVTDTIPDVSYLSLNTHEIQPAYFLNGHLVDETFVRCMDAQKIENIEVIRDSIKIENVQYYGQIRIESKRDYQPKIISLKDLILKYTALTAPPDIIMIEERLYTEDYEHKYVDEKYILKIVVQELKSDNRDGKLILAKLITRTEQNVAEANRIIIRGDEINL